MWWLVEPLPHTHSLTHIKRCREQLIEPVCSVWSYSFIVSYPSACASLHLPQRPLSWLALVIERVPTWQLKLYIFQMQLRRTISITKTRVKYKLSSEPALVTLVLLLGSKIIWQSWPPFTCTFIFFGFASIFHIQLPLIIIPVSVWDFPLLFMSQLSKSCSPTHPFWSNYSAISNFLKSSVIYRVFCDFM